MHKKASTFTTPKNLDEYTNIHYNSPTPGRIGVEPAELGGQADCLREAGKVWGRLNPLSFRLISLHAMLNSWISIFPSPFTSERALKNERDSQINDLSYTQISKSCVTLYYYWQNKAPIHKSISIFAYIMSSILDMVILNNYYIAVGQYRLVYSSCIIMHYALNQSFLENV